MCATGAVSAEDIERYKAQFSEPGALTAALNYYRAMVRPLPASCIPSHPLSLHRVLPSIVLPSIVTGLHTCNARWASTSRGHMQLSLCAALRTHC
jgi:hypothetical protein